jgi:CTP synthase
MKKIPPKFIFVVGGVMSSVGKGIAAASLGRLLKDSGFSVTALKIDPYINVDAGTMNPTEHGEVFVTEDGDETDQDIGNYERFLETDIKKINYMTTGRVYLSVIEQERAMKFKGKCVEVVPHVPMEVIRRIKTAQASAESDVTIIEIGGTIGEYQSVLFLEALRMMKQESPNDVVTVMVSYLPIPGKVGEMKTKPTQYAVRTLNSTGIFPDFLLCRSEMKLDEPRKEKLALFCNVPKDCILSAPDVESIYDIPLNFEKQGFGDLMINKLGLVKPKKSSGMSQWKSFVKKRSTVTKPIKIAIVGKYFETGSFTLSDSYLSVIEAIKFSAYHLGLRPEITWVNALDFERDKKTLKQLDQFDGVLVPGGFGSRGVEGKILAIEYARKNKIPYLGICYGMQLMVIEYARHVAKLSGATTHEIDPNAKHLIIDVMHDQKNKLEKNNYGGSMRLGAYPAVLAKNTQAYQAYKTPTISERHRHRYEVNNAYKDQLEQAGLIFSGTSPDGHLCEIAELPKNVHPFFLAVQFHPEFKARPLAPHPLFTAFVKSAGGRV